MAEGEAGSYLICMQGTDQTMMPHGTKARSFYQGA